MNLEDSGGAFSLMFQVQKKLCGRIIFDYFTMSKFKNKTIVKDIETMGGKIEEAELRRNRLLGHMALPFVFYRFLKGSDYQIIHIHADTAWKLLVYAFPAKIAGIRTIIIHAHSSYVNGDYRWVKYLLHIISKSFLVCVSTDMLSCSDKATRWMYNKNNQDDVIVISNCVEAEKYQFNQCYRDEERRRIGIEDGHILVGTVGDYSYPKNPYFFVDILEKVRKVNDKVYAVYVGDGSYRRQVERYANKRHVNDYMVFYGKSDNLQNIYSAMDIFLMPSRFEGFPISAIEAQANGLKCILSDRITKKVGILDDCEFLDISNVNGWCKRITKYIEENVNYNHLFIRKEAVDLVKKKGFDIGFASNELLSVYCENKDIKNAY